MSVGNEDNKNRIQEKEKVETEKKQTDLAEVEKFYKSNPVLMPSALTDPTKLGMHFVEQTTDLTSFSIFYLSYLFLLSERKQTDLFTNVDFIGSQSDPELSKAASTRDGRSYRPSMFHPER